MRLESTLLLPISIVMSTHTGLYSLLVAYIDHFVHAAFINKAIDHGDQNWGLPYSCTAVSLYSLILLHLYCIHLKEKVHTGTTSSILPNFTHHADFKFIDFI